MKYAIEIQRWIPQEDGTTYKPKDFFWTGGGESDNLYKARLYKNKGAAASAMYKIRKRNWIGLFTVVVGVSDELCKEIELCKFAIAKE